MTFTITIQKHFHSVNLPYVFPVSSLSAFLVHGHKVQLNVVLLPCEVVDPPVCVVQQAVAKLDKVRLPARTARSP